MTQDVALTSRGMPAIVMGETRYPLLFSPAAIKEWAEYKDVTFKEALDAGWKGSDLDWDDMRCLLKVAIATGELRRMMFEGPPAHEVSDALIDQLMKLMHRLEIGLILALAWNQPPGPPDPPAAPESSPAGEPSSE